MTSNVSVPNIHWFNLLVRNNGRINIRVKSAKERPNAIALVIVNVPTELAHIMLRMMGSNMPFTPFSAKLPVCTKKSTTLAMKPIMTNTIATLHIVCRQRIATLSTFSSEAAGIYRYTQIMLNAALTPKYTRNLLSTSSPIQIPDVMKVPI
jgi:hypothetical protein